MNSDNKKESAAFRASVIAARQAWSGKRNRAGGLQGADFATIAKVVLDQSFWPFQQVPMCQKTSRYTGFPCACRFADDSTINVPGNCRSAWDFLHQLAHWCLPMEGHNKDFRSLYAAFIQQAFGQAATRYLFREFEQRQLDYDRQWALPSPVRREYLRPFLNDEQPAAHLSLPGIEPGRPANSVTAA